MKILIDADACPKVIKEILYRTAIRTETLVILIANKRLEIPFSPFIKMHKVPAGFDEADDEIVRRTEPGDLVITADIPLADEVIQKGGLAINPRGTLYTKENIKERLSMRDLMQDLRESGTVTCKTNTFTARNKQDFANQLDRLLTKGKKN
jgi:uncharacterized protein YaiI (UPF0178 family)